MTASMPRSYQAFCTAVLPSSNSRLPTRRSVKSPMALEVASWNSSSVGPCLSSSTSACETRLASPLASAGGCEMLASRKRCNSSPSRAAAVSVGLDRYRFMSCTSTAMLRTSASARASCAWRVTLAAASGR